MDYKASQWRELPPKNNTPFEFTIEEIVRLFQSFSIYETNQVVKSKNDVINLLRRAEIGPVTNHDVHSFFEILDISPGDDVTFPM
jgi:hypothetical protein